MVTIDVAMLVIAFGALLLNFIMVIIMVINIKK